MDKLKQNMQIAYNSLIDLSNGAYENCHNPILKQAGLTGQWVGKCEAYEYGAHLINSALMLSGIFLEPKITERKKHVEIERQEDCAADAEIENEREEVRENQPY